VQKVSNLILNINVYMEDAESGKMKFARSIEIRGNTDESWRRGTRLFAAQLFVARTLTAHRQDPQQAFSRVPVARMSLS
jgi:hypothetical protein